MAIVNQVHQSAYLPKPGIIKFQLITHCFFKNITLTPIELECLALLAQDREVALNVFCRYVERKELYASAQSVRNVINKFEKIGLIEKSGKKNKKVRLNSDIPIQTDGNILLEYKLVHLS